MGIQRELGERDTRDLLDDDLFDTLEKIRKIIDHRSKHTRAQKQKLISQFNLEMDMRDPQRKEVRFEINAENDIVPKHHHR